MGSGYSVADCRCIHRNPRVPLQSLPAGCPQESAWSHKRFFPECWMCRRSRQDPFLWSCGDSFFAAIADQKTCERVMISGRRLFVKTRRPSCFFCLHRLKYLHADDGLVGVFNMVLRKLTRVPDLFLRKMIFTEGLLQDQISRVGIVAEDRWNDRFMPLLAEAWRDAFYIQPLGNGQISGAIQIFIINAADKFSFLRDNIELSVFQPITEQCSVPGQSFFKVPFDAPLLILTDRTAFLLCVWLSEDRNI